jgi:hypothetical protein
VDLDLVELIIMNQVIIKDGARIVDLAATVQVELTILEEVQGLEMMRFTIPGLEAKEIGVEGQAL